jgi:cytochrome P450
LSFWDDAGKPLSADIIRADLLTLIVAGYETMTSALIWALYWSSQLPTRLDIQTELTSRDRDPTTLARLPYLSAVCAETLRLYPVAIAGFSRTCRVPFSIGSTIVPAGTVLSPSIYLAQRRAQVYPEPRQFRPERFIERQFSPYEYLPFGGGDRRCLGAALALYQMKLIVATVIRTTRLIVHTKGSTQPVRYGITMAPPTHWEFSFEEMN